LRVQQPSRGKLCDPAAVPATAALQAARQCLTPAARARAGLIKPVAHTVAESLEPITKDLTRGALQPLAQGLAENAVPVANDFADNTLLPAADMIAEQARLAGAWGPRLVVGRRWSGSLSFCNRLTQ